MSCGMPRILHDRYYANDGEHACDLATGQSVPMTAVGAPRTRRTPLPQLLPLIEVLEHGREGEPRWVTIDAAGSQPPVVVDDAAAEARARGYVPIAVDLYLRLRMALADDLQDRTLLLIAAPSIAIETARGVLLDAAVRAPRPHVLLSVRASNARRTHHAPGNRLWLVREARAVYGARPLAARAPGTVPEEVARHLARAARAGDFVRTGRHAAAERLLREVAAALARRGAYASAVQAGVSLGRLLLERGRPSEADAVFDQAASHAAAAQDDALACWTRVWQAAARTDAGRLTSAEAMTRAALLCGTLTADQRAHAGAMLVRILLWQERADDAAAVGLQVPEPDAPSFAFACAMLVRLLLERGEIFRAGQAARTLLDTHGPGSTDPAAEALAHTAHLRVLLAAGDLHLGASTLASLSRAARAARSPLRLVRGRLLWADALSRAGRTREAAAELASLQRARRALPPLLRGAIEKLAEARRASAARPAVPPATAVPFAAAALVTAAQGEENDADAVRCVLEVAARALQASRVDVCSADGGPATVVCTVGHGMVTRLGPRVLDAGIRIGPEPGDPSRETGVPLRLGTRLVAALVARWPVDRTPPEHAPDLLAVAAAAAAPRVDAMIARSREAAQASTLVPELVGASAAMSDVRKAIARAAGAPFAVLVEGESGVGKELVARAIHHLSARRERRLCDVNCAALPDDLLESELFGHARGAFTGAVTDRAGLVEEADGGTLFLDEVADLSPRAQAKLLRVIQQQEVRRVGETFTRPVDVRIVSAANRDMRVEAAERRFRQDLLYRLDVIRIRVPALRERPEDIALLAGHFWRAASARVGSQAVLAHAVLAALTRYHWPGNVRELQNVMSALAVAAPARGEIRPSLLPAVVTTTTAITSGRLADARAQFERRFVEVALARAGGSRTQAARELGLSRQGLLKLLERHRLVITPSGGPSTM